MRHRARRLRVTLTWELATARGSSRVADRLPTLTKGKGSFKKGEWQEQHQQAFEAAKAAIAGAKLLSYLDYSVPIRLRTDACDVGAGAMLYQVVDGQDRPVSFMSHSFSAPERRWSTFEQTGLLGPGGDGGWSRL